MMKVRCIAILLCSLLATSIASRAQTTLSIGSASDWNAAMTSISTSPNTSHVLNLVNDLLLAADLAAVNVPLGSTGIGVTVNGNGHFIDGANTHRGIFVGRGMLTISNLTIKNAVARGGNGGNGGGGGGAGLGGGLFVAAFSQVVLTNVHFLNNGAVGGSGGLGTLTGGGGGGGMGGSGGDFTTGAISAGGGGGVGGAGGTAGSGSNGLVPGASPGGNGAANWNGGSNGGGGGGGLGAFGGGGGGIDGATGSDTEAGSGGYGGGGGGIPSGIPGSGGFGGGGGASDINGGSGGFGGGSGGSRANGIMGSPGFGGGSGSASGGHGGGGLGAGGAIFVQNQGNVILIGSTSVSGSFVVPGASGGGGATAGSAKGSGFFLNGSPLQISVRAGETMRLSDDIAETGLAQYGDGTLAFTGAKTYPGPTNIDAGKLTVENSSGSATGPGEVNISTTLATSGDASIAGIVRIRVHASLEIASSHHLTVGDLQWNRNGTIVVPVGGYADEKAPLAISNTLSATGNAPVNLELVDNGLVKDRTYPLITFGDNSGLAAANIQVSGIPGARVSLSQNTLTVTVPTPLTHGISVRVANRHHRAAFFVTNTGNANATFQVSANVPKSSPHNAPLIAYHSEGRDVSSLLAGHRYRIVLAAGATQKITAKIQNPRRAERRRVFKLRLNARNLANPSVKDSAQATLTLKGPGG